LVVGWVGRIALLEIIIQRDYENIIVQDCERENECEHWRVKESQGASTSLGELRRKVQLDNNGDK
jgi:hypothetical protein